MSFNVHIHISDKDWIIEKMAKALSENIHFVTYDTKMNKYADIIYYLPYYTMKNNNLSSISIAYFTHCEENDKMRAKFFQTAKRADQCVCMSLIYANMLRDAGVTAIELIPPGVDLESYQARIKIGVVGRTYPTGRKGEELVRQVMDVQGVDWYFTGDGWPGPALNLSDAELPAFYRSMDYILIPARYEGGPMSAIEALACGIEVIAPEVGWMPDLPHISFRRDDADDLRGVLRRLLEIRLNRRQAVMDRSWDRFVSDHDTLFRRLSVQLPNPIVRSSRRIMTSVTTILKSKVAGSQRKGT